MSIIIKYLTPGTIIIIVLFHYCCQSDNALFTRELDEGHYYHIVC